MSAYSSLDKNLDALLEDVGDFGKYQRVTLLLVCIGVILHSAVHIAFVFSAKDLKYRCKILGCDTSDPEYKPDWLKNAVPFLEQAPDDPEKCMRYVINNTIETLHNCTDKAQFTSEKESCHSFVYGSVEKTIVQEYDLHCPENLWKLGLVGTINSFGQFFGLFMSGIISDRFGRRVTFIMGLVLCGICGLLRTLAPTYVWFLVLEFLDAFFGAGSYVGGFIIGVELVGPKKRVLTGTLSSSCYAVGEVIAGGTAWFCKEWRLLIYILYSPTLLLIFYFWLIPESIRWKLSKGNEEYPKKILRQVAKFNTRTLSETALNKLKAADQVEAKISMRDIFKSTILVWRFANCIFCWITCAFLFYILTLSSVSLAGNSYLDFILTSIIEIPAYFTCLYVVDRLGRIWSLSGAFFLTGLCCLTYLFTPSDMHYIGLPLWMIGKFGATAAFTITYVITSELFPTPLRQTMMGTCSTLGRIGAMAAPQAPLLAQIWTPLPILLSIVMAFAAGLLTCLFPESTGVKLPDTIEEAVAIGRTQEHI